MSLRALEDQTILDELLRLREKISELQDREKELKAEILNAVMDEPEGVGYHETDGVPYKLSYYFRKSGWKYSDELEEDLNLVKAKQKYEQKSGIAVPGKQSAVLRIEIQKARHEEVADPLGEVFD